MPCLCDTRETRKDPFWVSHPFIDVEALHPVCEWSMPRPDGVVPEATLLVLRPPTPLRPLFPSKEITFTYCTSSTYPSPKLYAVSLIIGGHWTQRIQWTVEVELRYVQYREHSISLTMNTNFETSAPSTARVQRDSTHNPSSRPEPASLLYSVPEEPMTWKEFSERVTDIGKSEGTLAYKNRHNAAMSGLFNYPEDPKCPDGPTRGYLTDLADWSIVVRKAFDDYEPGQTYTIEGTLAEAREYRVAYSKLEDSLGKAPAPEGRNDWSSVIQIEQKTVRDTVGKMEQCESAAEAHWQQSKKQFKDRIAKRR